MIKIIEGNIVNAKTDFIIHQVNCQGEMNTGVAKALRDYDEGIYKHYRKFCEFCKFESEELLGTCDAYLLKDRGQIVLSLFAQNKYGYDGKQYTDIEAFRDGLRYISQHFGVWREKNGLEGKDLCRTSVALPYKIGCGRGGADWEVIYKIIEGELKDYDVEFSDESTYRKYHGRIGQTVSAVLVTKTYDDGEVRQYINRLGGL